MAATARSDPTRSSPRIRTIVLLLTALTGFAGLAYEVAWQRYLATLLGAQSEATAAVLAIFLGGLSAGYWLFGAVTRGLVARSQATGRPPPLLACYGDPISREWNDYPFANPRPGADIDSAHRYARES